MRSAEVAGSDGPAGAAPAEVAAKLLERHREISAPQTFRLLGLDWDLLEGVYAPHLTQSAALYAEWLPYPVDGSFCEIGCGTGYLSVTAAQRGCASVVATDVSAAAVENARRNADRHGVSDRMRAVESDLFDGLDASERYDVVFWNSSFVHRSDDAPITDDLERALFDPGYATHNRFFRDAAARLQPGGRLLLGFTTLGDGGLLVRLARRHGWALYLLRSTPCRAPTGPVEYQLIEASQPP